jgi:hypothetical protein
MLAALALQVYVNGSANEWFGGGGYGPRRFSGALAILVVGYATLIGLRPGRWWRSAVIALSAALAGHQWLLLSRGFVDQIGGHVVSMGDSPQWHAEGIAVFLRRLGATAIDALRQPAQTLVLPGSALTIVWTQPRLLVARLLLLVAILACLAVVWRIGLGAARLVRGRRWCQRLLPLIVGAGALITSWWLVSFA